MGWATCVAYREPGTHEPIDQTCLVASMASHDEESIGASSMMEIDQLASGNGRDSRTNQVHEVGTHQEKKEEEHGLEKLLKACGRLR